MRPGTLVRLTGGPPASSGAGTLVLLTGGPPASSGAGTLVLLTGGPPASSGAGTLVLLTGGPPASSGAGTLVLLTGGPPASSGAGTLVLLTEDHRLSGAVSLSEWDPEEMGSTNHDWPGVQSVCCRQPVVQTQPEEKMEEQKETRGSIVSAPNYLWHKSTVGMRDEENNSAMQSLWGHE
ncbi:unnamed protein product [Arctogadus glacialis]